MGELRKKVSALLRNYFEEKTANFNFYDDRQAKDKVSDIIDNLTDSVEEQIQDADRMIDSVYENFDSTTARKEWIENMKADQALEDYKDTNFEHGLFLTR